MKKWILAMLLMVLFCGCGRIEQMERAPVGIIGRDISISRELAAKTIALAFYTPQELEEMETEADFLDVTVEDWAYPYICGCVEQGFFAGSEEGTFRPQDALTLWEAQALMERISPDYNSRIVLTEKNKNMAVSYELWIQLLETSLKARKGEESLMSYGLETENAVLLTEDGLFDTGKYDAAGIDLKPYLYSRISFLKKDGEIAALLAVEALSPMIWNIYCRKTDGQLLLETGEGTAIFPNKKNFSEGIAHVKLENGKIAEILPAQSLGRCEVKRVNEQEIYLTGTGAIPWAENARIYNGKNTEWTKDDFASLICGTAAAEFYETDGKISGAVIREDIILENIRVFLKGGEQEKVMLSAEKGFTLSNTSNTKAFGEGETAMLTADLPWFDNGIVEVSSESPINVSFMDGTAYCYEGTLELERRGENSFSIINELPIERYLLGVVPHEMPVSFGQTALEVQAMTARSYAYNQFYSNTYCEYGAHVADTVASQVYLGFMENETVQEAVDGTAGQCIVTEDGRVAQTYFYSTSCGFGASSNEIWSKDGTFSGTSKTYLTAQSFGDFGAPETEEDWLAFWQDWEQEGYDMDSSWYRWKVYFGCGQLSEILEKTLAEAAQMNPALILMKGEDGSFQQGVPKKFGRLQGMTVTRRGTGGVVMELELEFETETVRVRTENTIRRVLSPTRLTVGEEIYLQRKSGESLTGNTMLPSGFFAVKEMRNKEGALTGIALYGGGNGHGVGMSQYGAKRLAEQGKTAVEIAAQYFPGTRIERVY